MDILGGIGNILGGILGYEGAKDQRELQKQQADQNIALQKEFAQQGLRWKVADAQAAGIHPLYALGGQTHAFSPVSVGTSNVMSPLADMAKNLGQDLSRSVDATRSPLEKQEARVASVTAPLQVENMQLRNDFLRAQIAKLNASTNPGIPAPGDATNYEIPGQTATALVKPKPLEVAPGNAQQPSGEGGAIADIGYARTKTGWAVVPSKDVKERIEDQIIPETLWAIRNHIFPTLQSNQAPPPFTPPEGKKWIFNPLRQEYQLIDRANVSRGFLGGRR